MISITENPAALAPKKSLTNAQQNALRCIDLYKHQKKVGADWWIGNFKFSGTLIAKLQLLRLVVERRHRLGPFLAITEAGDIAVAQLKKGARP